MRPDTVAYRSLETSHSQSSKDADALSRLPMDIVAYMKLCTKKVCQIDIMACCVGVGALGRGEAISVSAVSTGFSLLKIEKVSLGCNMTKISNHILLMHRNKTK